MSQDDDAPVIPAAPLHHHSLHPALAAGWRADVKGILMREGIHPDYHPIVFRDKSANFAFLTRSTLTSEQTIDWEDGNTYPVVDVDISSASHPFWTGKGRILDTAGRVEKFERRYGKRVR